MRGETLLVAKARADRGTIHNVPVLMLVAAVVILAGVVVVASGRGGEIAPEYPDYPPIDLGPVTAADVALLRPPSAAWGYNMRVTDEALETIARAVTERDIKIAELQQQVDDLRGEPPQQRERPSGAWPAVADAGNEGAEGVEEAEGAEGAEEAEEAEGSEGAGPARSEWPFADRSALLADPETTRPEAFTARPGAGSAEGTGQQPGDRDTTNGTGQHATGGPASAPVWSGASRDDLPHNTGEPTNPDLPQQSPVWAAAGQQHEAGPQQAGYGEGWASAAGPGPAGSSSGPAEASRPGPPWAKVTSPWDGPDDAGAEPFVWDDSHQTLVWGAEHQRAKASRLQEQDEAAESGQHEPETGQATAELGQATAGGGPGRARRRPGHSGAGPARARDRPGHGGAGSGHSGTGPGRAPDRPGHSGAGPARARDRPGHGGVGSGHSRAGPGHSGTGPARARDRPGHSGAGSGHSGTGPGTSPGPARPQRDRASASPGPARPRRRRVRPQRSRARTPRTPTTSGRWRTASRTVTDGATTGPDGQPRCPWGLSAPEYLAYHDDEWGRPLHGDQAIFERLCLEAFQSGLSWLTILRKRENFRAAFAGFDIAAVAGFGDDDVQRLLADAGIVRNRSKITAAITNARAALDVAGGLSDLVWKYAGEPTEPPRTLADVPAQTPASKALSAELRRSGFTFTGPVTAYATMQACGVVNDHLAGCFCRER